MQFPKLKTEAVAQYPSSREFRFATEVLTFIDGTEQRFRCFPKRLRKWNIELDLLDDRELAAVEAFFEAGAAALTFDFTDPWDGATVTNCSLENPEAEFTYLDENRARTTLTIMENQG